MGLKDRASIKSDSNKKMMDALDRILKKKGPRFTRRDLKMAALEVLGPAYSNDVLDSWKKTLIKMNLVKLLPDGSFMATEKAWEEIARVLGRRTLDEFLKQIGRRTTLDEVQAALEHLEEITIPRFYDILERYGVRVSEIIRGVAERGFFDENPRNLLRQMLEDCVRLHNEYCNRYRHTTSETEKRKFLDAMERLRKIVESVFIRYLQLPRGREPPAVLDVPREGEVREMKILNNESLELLLRKRVIDERVIVDYQPLVGNAFTGIDSSITEVRPLFEPPLPPFNLIVSITIDMSSSGGEPEIIVKPSPDEVAMERIGNLEKEGYVVPGSELLYFDDYYIKRIEEALMQRLQYRAALDSLKQCNPNKPSPNVSFMDGRIWPTEHKVADIFAPHRKYVISALSDFHNLVRYLDDTNTSVVGVVKRGHLGFLWYLVFWYAYKIKIIDERIFVMEPRLYESLENKDGTIALWLLMLYYARTHRFARLFAVRRKFYAMDDEVVRLFLNVALKRGGSIVDLEEEPAFWTDVVQEMLLRKELEERDDVKRIEAALQGKQFMGDLPEDFKTIIERLNQEEKKRLAEELEREELLHRKYALLKERLGLPSPIEQSQLLRWLLSCLSDLYAFGDIASFYFLPPIEYKDEFVKLYSSGSARIEPGKVPSFSLPRIDVLLPVIKWRLLRKNEREEARKVIERVLYRARDFELFVWYSPEEGVLWNLILPAPIMLAHTYAKGLREDLGPKYAAIITAAIAAYRQ
ncbi:MAG: hypothetical protein QXO15_08620 [Nitrososphaerota archaeon]